LGVGLTRGPKKEGRRKKNLLGTQGIAAKGGFGSTTRPSKYGGEKNWKLVMSKRKEKCNDTLTQDFVKNQL